MKKFVVILAINAAMALSAKAALIAGWDFQTTTNGGTAVAAPPSTPTSYAANFGSGTLYFDGTNGSSAWITATSGNELTGFGGTTVNAATGFSISTTSPSALGIENTTANGKSFVFVLSTTGSQDLVLTYAAQRTSTGFNSVDWSYSTDGLNFTDFGPLALSATSFATQTVDFTGVSALNNQTTVYIKATVSGATNAGGNNRLDNIQFNVTAAPEPATFSIMGLGAAFLGFHRRRKLA